MGDFTFGFTIMKDLVEQKKSIALWSCNMQSFCEMNED